jgi:hypothetical protein
MKKSSSSTARQRPVESGTPGKSARPIEKKEEVQQSNDEHIDQDFPGFPHDPSKEKTISNGSGSGIKNGSGGAFEATEATRDDEDSDEDNDDRALDSNY